jgi:beta-phosphoglucomutase
MIRKGFGPFPGLPQELAHWKNRPLGLATSSARGEVAFMLGQLGFTGLFDPIITCDDVKRSKPAPDCYLLAAERFGVKPNDCVVVEDSAHGIRAALEAGTRVLAVSTAAPGDLAGVLAVFPSTVEALRWLRM